MGKITEYELIAEGVERLLTVQRPRIDTHGGANARVLVPPVTILGELTLDGTDLIWAPKEIAPDLLTSFNVAYVVPKDDIRTGLMVFKWVRTAPTAQRRQARYHSKHMVLISVATIFEGQFHGFETRLCSFIGGRWVDAVGTSFRPHHTGSVAGRSVSEPALDDFDIRMSMSIALNLRYCYSAVLADKEDCLAVRVFAYPDTVRFLLRTRALGNEARRRALVHLVRRHRRRRSKAFKVAAHLRGEHRCTWAGLKVAVLPSQYDAESTGDGAVKRRLEDAGLKRWVD